MNMTKDDCNGYNYETGRQFNAQDKERERCSGKRGK